MRVSHVAIASSSEEEADQFYQDVLGLRKTKTVTLPANVMRPIFGIDEECKKINYEDGENRFEIFFIDQTRPRTPRPDHVCLEVSDLEAFLKKCEAMKVEIIRVAKGESIVIFIRDYDGNFFEIQEKK